MTAFIIKSTVCMAILLAFYYIFLQREKMHTFNRFYLIFSLVFSLVLPFIAIPIYKDEIIQLPTQTLLTLQNIVVTGARSDNHIFHTMVSIYICITCVLALRFIHNIKTLINLAGNNTKVIYKTSRLVLIPKDILPYTFLNYIFINKEHYENNTIEAELFTHEMVHVNQKHTLDILFIEALKIILWFNPLLYLYKKAIQLNHEFLADEKVIKTHNTIQYQNLLIQKAHYSFSPEFASSLNFSITKKRFIMMTKTTSRFIMLFKQIAIVPVLACLFLLSCEDNDSKTEAELHGIAALDSPAEYPGGMKAFASDIIKNVNLPKTDKDVNAKVFIYFVVEKDGSMSDIKITRDPGYGLGEQAKEALEAIDKKWKPGMKNNEPVRVAYSLPITVNIKG